ncbi:hypothetical protein Dform_00270 [Dehalogenimonas formicexedens]|uniref:Uncharacterized protein n=1 Tax=Dehalogenimonas formicexedens TaxID=1839801 RepID=A0A1P8F5C2_9CHLR|nr:hypothetical protein [Dehalogenimonas formicexedens]APV43630.1 hypothetical protein Dform_00270 [Dehalogenimonas formicexedens]
MKSESEIRQKLERYKWFRAGGEVGRNIESAATSILASTVEIENIKKELSTGDPGWTARWFGMFSLYALTVVEARIGMLEWILGEAPYDEEGVTPGEKESGT